MAENKLADLSMDFAVSILKVTDSIKGTILLSISCSVVRHLLVLIFVKQNMLTARQILYPSFKLR